MKKIKAILYIIMISLYIGCSSGGIVGDAIDDEQNTVNNESNIDNYDTLEPILMIKDKNNSEINDLNIKIGESQNISIFAQADDNNRIINFNIVPTTSSCAEIIIDPFDLNKTTISNIIKFTGVEECSFDFTLNIQDSIGKETTKSINVIVSNSSNTTIEEEMVITNDKPIIKINETTININQGEVKTINFTVVDNNNTNIKTDNILVSANKDIAVAIFKEIDIFNNQINILGLKEGSTTIRINAIDEKSLLVYKDITIIVSSSNNENIFPTLNITNKYGNDMTHLNLKVDDTYNISVYAEDINTDGLIKNFYTIPTSSNKCADISIGNFDLNKSIIEPIITFKGLEECTFSFIAMVENNYGLVSSKKLEISVIEDTNSSETTTNNDTIEDNPTDGITDTNDDNATSEITDDESNTTTYSFKNDNALYDLNACSNTNFKIINHMPLDISAETKDETNGIMIKSFLIPNLTIKYSEVTLYYKENTQVVLSNYTDFTNSFFKLTYDKSWVSEENNTVYIKYYASSSDELETCARIILNSEDGSNLSSQKVYR